MCSTVLLNCRASNCQLISNSHKRVCQEDVYVRANVTYTSTYGTKTSSLLKFRTIYFIYLATRVKRSHFWWTRLAQLNKWQITVKVFPHIQTKKFNWEAASGYMAICNKSDSAVTCCSGENANLMEEYNTRSVCPKGWTQKFVSDEKALFSLLSRKAMHLVGISVFWNAVRHFKLCFCSP